MLIAIPRILVRLMRWEFLPLLVFHSTQRLKSMDTKVAMGLNGGRTNQLRLVLPL